MTQGEAALAEGLQERVSLLPSVNQGSYKGLPGAAPGSTDYRLTEMDASFPV